MFVELSTPCRGRFSSRTRTENIGDTHHFPALKTGPHPHPTLNPLPRLRLRGQARSRAPQAPLRGFTLDRACPLRPLGWQGVYGTASPGRAAFLTQRFPSRFTGDPPSPRLWRGGRGRRADARRCLAPAFPPQPAAAAPSAPASLKLRSPLPRRGGEESGFADPVWRLSRLAPFSPRNPLLAAQSARPDPSAPSFGAVSGLSPTSVEKARVATRPAPKMPTGLRISGSQPAKTCIRASQVITTI
jgi:hypothetical protein